MQEQCACKATHQHTFLSSALGVLTRTQLQAVLRLIAVPYVLGVPGGPALVRAAVGLAFTPVWTPKEAMELEDVLSDDDVKRLATTVAGMRVRLLAKHLVTDNTTDCTPTHTIPLHCALATRSFQTHRSKTSCWQPYLLW
jgi:hypothetical protein